MERKFSAQIYRLDSVAELQLNQAEEGVRDFAAHSDAVVSILPYKNVTDGRQDPVFKLDTDLELAVDLEIDLHVFVTSRRIGSSHAYRTTRSTVGMALLSRGMAAVSTAPDLDHIIEPVRFIAQHETAHAFNQLGEDVLHADPLSMGHCLAVNCVMHRYASSDSNINKTYCSCCSREFIESFEDNIALLHKNRNQQAALVD